MRLRITVLAALLYSVTAHSQAVYPTVDAYLHTAMVPNGGCLNHDSSTAQLGGERRFLVGIMACREAQFAFLFILEPRVQGYVVKESRHFQIDSARVRYGFGVDEVLMDTNHRFHIQITYGSAGTPTSDVFRFSLVNGEWRVAGRDHRTTEDCGDQSFGDGSRYSENYLTGKVVITDYRSCKPRKAKTRVVKFPKMRWRDFDPFDSQFDPETYGIKWDAGGS